MKNNCTIQIVLAMGLLLVQPILTTGNATTSLAPLIDAIEQADYQQFKLQLAAQQSISPACLNQLLSQALFVSNWPCNPED
ncbi:MAG TPA: hypothetical protein VJJ83_01860, partial [Candidatus Babeliales bacterium]|nr:hypothetical protein [Candidatus Babeliales bacterium]